MKKQASFTRYIPTIGYPIGKPTRDSDQRIQHLIDARRNVQNDNEIDSYNTILEQAYKEKYTNLE